MSLNRNEKIAKLARAFREWRGARNDQSGKCVRPPDPAALPRVVRWLGALNMGRAEFDLISSFTHYNQFDAWLAKL